VSAKTFNDSERISRFTISVGVNEDILKEKMTLTMKTKDEGSETYDKVLFRTDLEACTQQRGGFSSFFVPLIKDYINEFSNIKQICPLKKGDYYIKDFGVPGEIPWPNFLPKSMLGNGLRWEAIIELKGKTKKASKAFSHFLTLKLFGTSIV
jgi:Protein of unknown function (DUF1091)